MIADEDIRQARALKRAGDLNGLLQRLRLATATSDSFLQCYLIRLIEQLDDPHAVTDLGEQLADASQDVRVSAARALGALGSSWGIDPLVGALDDSSWLVRESAAYSLGEITDPRAAPALMHSLGSDPSRAVRASAAHALGCIADPAATESVTRALRDRHVLVRQEAAFALANFGDDIRSRQAITSATRSVRNVLIRHRLKKALRQLDARTATAGAPPEGRPGSNGVESKTRGIVDSILDFFGGGS